MWYMDFSKGKNSASISQNNGWHFEIDFSDIYILLTWKAWSHQNWEIRQLEKNMKMIEMLRW